MAARQGVKLKDHTVLALDIGSRFIKAAEIRMNRGMISLLNVAVRPTPTDVMNTNQILDPVGLGRAIKELLNINKIRTKKVIIAVNGQSSVVVRPIDLPKMSRKELADTMKFEVERHIPFTADEVVMDYAPIVEPDELPESESNMKVLLAVAQEELIKAYLKMLNAAGLQPIAMDVEILSAIRSLVDIQGESGGYDRTVALVNIGAVSTDISIVDRGNIIFTRSVPIAGNTLTEAIADQMGRSLDEAEELKKEYGCIFLQPLSLNENGSALAGADPTPNLGALPDAENPDALFGSYDTFGSPGMEPAVDAGPLGRPLFSLDEEFQTPGVMGFGTPETVPGSSSPDAPLFGTADAIPFEFDDDVDDEVPILQLGDDDDDEQHPVPTFRLDSEEVDDDVPETPLVDNTPPSLSSEPAPSLNFGPVFDLSSELENQMPAPLSRPTLDLDAHEGIALTPPTAETTPEMTFAPSQNLLGLDSLEPAVPAEPLVPTDPFAQQPTMQYYSGEISDHDEYGSQDSSFEHRIFDAMLPTLLELVAEIRRSLEYYSSREPETPVQRLVVYGGTSRLPNLAEFLSHEIGLEVQVANPVSALDLSAFRQPQEYLQDLAPALPVCIGLGLRDMIE